MDILSRPLSLPLVSPPWLTAAVAVALVPVLASAGIPTGRGLPADLEADVARDPLSASVAKAGPVKKVLAPFLGFYF